MRGLERPFLDDDSITVYAVTAIGSGTLFPWRDCILESLREWDKTCPYLALHDLSAKGVSVGFLTLSGREIFNIGITSLGQHQVEQILDKKRWQVSPSTTDSADNEFDVA